MIPHGLLTRVHGKCAVVRQIALKLQGGLDDLMSVTDMIRSVGAVPSTNRLQVKTIVASGSLPQKLGLAEGEPCVRLERVRGATWRSCRRASFSFC